MSRVCPNDVRPDSLSAASRKFYVSGYTECTPIVLRSFSARSPTVLRAEIERRAIDEVRRDGIYIGTRGRARAPAFLQA